MMKKNRFTVLNLIFVSTTTIFLSFLVSNYFLFFGRPLKKIGARFSNDFLILIELAFDVF